MERSLLSYLVSWINSEDRKPLIVRGARQVGKTWLVRHLASTCNKTLLEINFEKKLSLVSLFESNDPKHILLNLSAHFNQQIEPGNCLLFLDEIQAAPAIFSKLRWFAEDMPELPVIAAGSLLEFLLAEHSFSMPVGRISYMHLEPLSFEEFLLAHGKKILNNYLLEYNLTTEIPLALHEQLILMFKEYLIVGGLPAAVKSWVKEQSLVKINQIQNDLLTTYRDDFSKYKGRIEIERMDEVMSAIPKMLGKKFVYSRVNPDISATTFKQVIALLNKARISHRVLNCSANGVPLAAEIKEKIFKEIYLDTGLCSATLGLSLNQINEAKDLTLVNQGGLSEQVVGQILRTLNPPYIEPALYYWAREEKGSSAEIDYVIQCGNNIVPIEVKSGSTGTLKSLHLFMALKKLPRAVRINADLPSNTNIKVKLQMGNDVSYKLLSLPFYLVGQLYRLLNEV
ncbi:MAG TPA: AAA family ATPase [Gammaproteobacteria bacterium]|nr:AAA family ATPase [Gammaproteobacteria bacterium]